MVTTDQPARRELARDTNMTWLALFASTGTLICCALPILLVTLGLGATVAAITSAVPFLVVLAKHKAWFFAVSGGLILVAGWSAYRSVYICPADPRLAALCERMRRWNRSALWLSVAVWGTGFFAAYLLLPIRIWLDGLT
jgi:hypothetical protein